MDNRIINDFFNIGIDKHSVGRESVIGIATHCGLDGPVIESQWGGGEIFRNRPDRA